MCLFCNSVNYLTEKSKTRKKTEDIFQFVNKPYDLRNNRVLLRKRNRTVFVWNRKSLASRTWELIPQSLKDETELNSKLKSNMDYQPMPRQTV